MEKLPEEINREQSSVLEVNFEVKSVRQGYFISFPTKEDAREAIVNFWRKVDPDIERRIDEGMLDPEKRQITFGMRTEFSPMPPEHRGKGYQTTVFFSGNGNPLSAKALETLIELGYLSL